MSSYKALITAALAAGTFFAGSTFAQQALIETPIPTSTLAEPDGTTPLHWAVRDDRVDEALKLIKAGANVNAANRNGVTPLLLAAMNRNAEMVSALLNAGANPNATLPEGQTLLMLAARAGNAELVELLLNKGANVAATGPNFGENALMDAAAANQPEVIKILLKHGAEVNGRSKSMQYDKDRFGLEGVLTILPPGSWTPLMYAAREGSLEAARTLVEAGAQVDAADPEGSTPLLLAVTNGHFDTAKMLVEKGANVNLGDSTGMAALYAAIDMNTLGEVFGRPPRVSPDKLSALGLAKFLLEHGANANATLLKPTLQRAHTPGEPTLGEGATPIARAARNGDVAAMELLLAHGADVNQKLKNGTTPIMFAAGLGRGTSAFIIKEEGTDADLLAAAKLLVEHGADVNAVSEAGQTAMHFAAQAADANLKQPSDDMVIYLASKGAKLDVADNRKRTPIEMALGQGVRGHAGGPVKPREGTVELLKQLMAAQGTQH